MGIWKTAALSAALLGAAGAGAAMAPAASAQGTTRRAVAPQAVEVFGIGGGRIGVAVADLDVADAKTNGVKIETVDPDGPADKAGLKSGDIVVEFDGERVRSVRQFTRLVSETPAGRQVTAAVMREGRRVSVNVVPRESSAARVFSDSSWRALDELRGFARPTPAVPARPATPRPPTEPRAPRAVPPMLDGFLWTTGNQLGVTVNGLSDQLKEYFGAKDGVLVTSVTGDSAAAKAGVKAGDVIVSVNGTTIEDPAELRREMQRLDPNEEFTLSILRDRKAMTLKGKTEAGRGRRSTTRTIL